MESKIVNTMPTEKEVFVKMAVSAWETHNNRLNKLIATLTDEQLSADTAPNRNSGTYLLGHLIAVSDALFPILGWGDRLYPELEEIFLKKPDKAGLATPTIQQLKDYLVVINAKLAEHMSTMQPDEWFAKHTAVSDEDFAKEPFRNKLNVLMNRTNHLSYHLGQMAYLAAKA